MSDAAAEDAFRRAVAADGSLHRLARALTLAEGASLHLLEVETPRTLRAALPVLREALGERELEVVSRPFEELRTREDVVAEVLATLTVVREDGAPLVLDASTAMREERATWTWLFHRWNEGRERWLGTRRAPVVLALPPWLARLLAEEAPDLWSVRGPGARVTVGPPLAIPLLDRELIPGRRFDVDRGRSLASLEFSVLHAREASERSADEASRALLAEALLALGERQRAREDLAAAIECFADAMQVCEGEWEGASATRIWNVASTASIGIADAALLLGRTEEAAEEVVRGEALCSAEFVSVGQVGWTECLLAAIRVRLLAVRGSYDAAGAALEQAYEVGRRATSTLTDSATDAILLLLHVTTAEFHLDRGDPVRGLAYAVTAMEGGGPPMSLLWAEVLAVRAIRDASRKPEALHESSEFLRGHATSLNHSPVQYQVDADGRAVVLLAGAETARSVGDEETCALLTDAARRALELAATDDSGRPRLVRLRARLAALAAR